MTSKDRALREARHALATYEAGKDEHTGDYWAGYLSSALKIIASYLEDAS
jgi:hypothetical protein